MKRGEKGRGIIDGNGGSGGGGRKRHSAGGRVVRSRACVFPPPPGRPRVRRSRRRISPAATVAELARRPLFHTHGHRRRRESVVRRPAPPWHIVRALAPSAVPLLLSLCRRRRRRRRRCREFIADTRVEYHSRAPIRTRNWEQKKKKTRFRRRQPEYPGNDNCQVNDY